MKKNYRVKRFILAIAMVLGGLLGAEPLIAQPIPVGDIQEDQYRLLQLLSDSTVSTSFNNRPVWRQQYLEKFKELEGNSDSWWGRPLGSEVRKLTDFFSYGLYEPVFTNTVNSDLPYGGNNGAAWYGRGITTELQGGIWLTSDFLTVTLRPHLAWQQNTFFTTPRFIPRDSNGDPTYQAIFRLIDMPYRFGPEAYSTFHWGESSVRFHFVKLEAGFSSEPLWWGPGIRNALVISNNAPGLHHLFLGTRGPLSLPLNIGQVEFKLMGAWPKDSKYFSNTPQSERPRFTSGLNMIFAPSFIPNLHLGFTNITHRYIPEGGLSIDDFTSILPFAERQVGTIDEQNQLISVYFRWAFPESNAEIYGEYFREDSFFDLRDLFMEPDHDRAYTIGAQKIVSSEWIDFFKIQAEINNLVPNRLDEVRPQDYYYRHTNIREGHTNEGQVLGATVGPGSGSQFAAIDGYIDRGMLGFFIERVEQNDFFHYEFNDPLSINGYTDIWRNRVNLNIGLRGLYKTGDLTFSGKVIWNTNLNYGRFDYGDLDVNFETFEPHDVTNWHFQVQARYFFSRK